MVDKKKLYDHARSRVSEPVNPDDLIEDSGDMSPDPKSLPSRLYKQVKRKNEKEAKEAEDKKDDDEEDDFDPEGEGYDYKTAKKRGLEPKSVDDDDKPHWPSRDPETGVLLKGKKHKTFDKGVEEDAKLGYKLRKRDDGRYVTEKEE